MICSLLRYDFVRGFIQVWHELKEKLPELKVEEEFT